MANKALAVRAARYILHITQTNNNVISKQIKVSDIRPQIQELKNKFPKISILNVLPQIIIRELLSKKFLSIEANEIRNFKLVAIKRFSKNKTV